MNQEVKFSCMSCQTPLSAEPEDIGELMECPSCHNTMKVPPFGVIPRMKLGDFTVEKLLGLGGMGEVWLANQESMNRNVALKVLSPELAGDALFVKRFLQEVTIAGKLAHPNIVMAYQAGEQNGIRYLAISYIDGKVLGETLVDNQPLPDNEALRIIRDIAKALKYAWEKFHILHRDIKPDNIMISSDGTPMLMDMGISKITDANESLTLTGTILGTPNYISPEQARADADIDTRADQYSLGATLYHLLTGQLPYSATTPMGILAQHLQEPVPEPQKANPNITDECQNLIKKMMAKKKEDRFSSWDEVIAVCDQLLQDSGKSITHLPTSVTPDVPETKKSKWKKYSIAALIILLLIAVFSLKNKLNKTKKENQYYKDIQEFNQKLDEKYPQKNDDAKKTPEVDSQPATKTRDLPQVTQLISSDGEDDSKHAAKPDKPTEQDKKDKTWSSKKKSKKAKLTQREEKIKVKLEERLKDIDDESLVKLIHLVTRYQDETIKIWLKKGPKTGIERLRKMGQSRQFQEKVLTQAKLLLTEKQLEKFSNFIKRPHKPPRRRMEDRMKNDRF